MIGQFWKNNGDKTKNEDGSITYVGRDYYEYLFKDATGYDVDMNEAIDYMQQHLDDIITNIKN